MKRLVLGFFMLAVISGQGFADTDDPTGPQPTLPSEQLTIIADDGKSYVFTVELPVTDQQQMTGLMFRAAVPAATGMLFVFPEVQVAQFWMKNTIVPLDMVGIGADGTVKSITENTVPYSLRVISSTVPVLAMLELQGGITATLDIGVGDRVIAKPFNGG